MSFIRWPIIGRKAFQLELEQHRWSFTHPFPVGHSGLAHPFPPSQLVVFSPSLPRLVPAGSQVSKCCTHWSNFPDRWIDQIWPSLLASTRFLLFFFLQLFTEVWLCPAISRKILCVFCAHWFLDETSENLRFCGNQLTFYFPRRTENFSSKERKCHFLTSKREKSSWFEASSVM